MTDTLALDGVTIKSQLLAVVRNAGDALSQMTRLERGLHTFWLLGPFICLIERTPADLWISCLALGFVVRSVIQRDRAWLGVFWVRACFLFFGICLVSSVFSTMPLYALSESVAWFRFPVFAMATVFWLAVDRRLLYAMILSTAFGMLLMAGILIAEMLIEGQKAGRLSWPFDDLVSGNYLTKVGLPAFIIMVALAVGGKSRLAAVMASLTLITLTMSVLTGERMNFLILAASGMLAAIVWRTIWHRVFGIVIFVFLAVSVVFTSLPNLKTRFLDEFLRNLPVNNESAYFKMMAAGLKAFESSPAFGIGTATHRELCPNIIGDLQGFLCDNHPHNFYVQLLAETGMLGLLAGILMICSIITATFFSWRKNQANVAAATAFIVPLGLFFPLQSTGDFFGQWNNIFLWSAVALALASARTLLSGQDQQIR